MLEKIQSEIPSINRLTLNEIQGGVMEDIANLINEGDWEDILGFIEQTPHDENYGLYVAQRADLHVLNPQKVPTLKSTSSEFQLLKNCLKENCTPFADSAASYVLSYIPIFNPKLLESLEVEDSVWRDFREKVDHYEKSKVYESLVDFEVLALKLNKKPIPDTPKLLKTLKECCISFSKQESFNMVAHSASNLRLIDSNQPFVSKAELKSIRNDVISKKNSKDWQLFLPLAANYRLITAREIAMTSSGLNLKMSEPFKFQQEGLPERRIF